MTLHLMFNATNYRQNPERHSQRIAEVTAYLLIPYGVPHVKGIIFQGILGIYPLLVGLILALVLLGLLDHSLNLVLAQAALVIGDCNLVLSAYTAIPWSTFPHGQVSAW